MAFCGEKLMLYDEACLHVNNNGLGLLKLFIQSSECYQCDDVPIHHLKRPVVVSTTYSTILHFIRDNGELPYNKTEFHFGQHGHYNVSVTDNIDIITDIAPDDAYAPLKIEIIVLLIITLLWSINAFAPYVSSSFSRYIDIRGLFHTGFSRELQNDFGSPSENSSEPSGLISTSTETSRSSLHSSRSTRVQSLDTFRGLTIVLMLFVNYGGGKYKFFQHSPWNGLTIADVVFPWFGFIMGMSLLLSISALYRNTNSRCTVLLKVFLRSLVIIFLGIMLNSMNHNNIYQVRLPGVLQRLGLAYFIVGFIETCFLRIHMADMVGRAGVTQVYGFFQWLTSLLLVAAHCCLTFLFQVPGCPTGYIGPGGLHQHKSAENCTGGAAGYIDRTLFTECHLYARSTSKEIYHNNVPFDPEGFLGTLTAAFTVFLGVHAVRLYMVCRSPKKLILQWFVIAVISGMIAGFLCRWSQEEGLVPINKNLWSVSFALATASLAFIMISILYYAVDYKKFWSGSPFKQVGKNAILIYILSSILKETFPWQWAPVHLTTHTEALIMDTWGTVLWIIIAVVLSNNNIYIAI